MQAESLSCAVPCANYDYADYLCNFNQIYMSSYLLWLLFITKHTKVKVNDVPIFWNDDVEKFGYTKNV